MAFVNRGFKRVSFRQTGSDRCGQCAAAAVCIYFLDTFCRKVGKCSIIRGEYVYQCLAVGVAPF